MSVIVTQGMGQAKLMMQGYGTLLPSTLGTALNPVAGSVGGDGSAANGQRETTTAGGSGDSVTAKGGNG